MKFMIILDIKPNATGSVLRKEWQEMDSYRIILWLFPFLLSPQLHGSSKNFFFGTKFQIIIIFNLVILEHDTLAPGVFHRVKIVQRFFCIF